jgi:hypothetical protein
MPTSWPPSLPPILKLTCNRCSPISLCLRGGGVIFDLVLISLLSPKHPTSHNLMHTGLPGSSKPYTLCLWSGDGRQRILVCWKLYKPSAMEFCHAHRGSAESMTIFSKSGVNAKPMATLSLFEVTDSKSQEYPKACSKRRAQVFHDSASPKNTPMHDEKWTSSFPRQYQVPRIPPCIIKSGAQAFHDSIKSQEYPIA